jgi:hypothetical protein
MDTIRSALLGQLEQTIERLNGLGGAVAFEDYPGALGHAPCSSRGYGPPGRDRLGSRVLRGS